MKPNIFKLSPKELIQDGFFSWLMNWADPKNNNIDSILNQAGADFVKMLLGDMASDDFVINEIKVDRQWNNIDITACVNNCYFIVIEDKINTMRHSNQLKRYKDQAQEHCNKHNLVAVFIYLKTGNESQKHLRTVIDENFRVINRKSILEVLNRHPSNNAIYVDFKEILQERENKTNSFKRFEDIKTNWRSAEGFFLWLEGIKTSSNWGKVNNRKGGFLCFWYHVKYFNKSNMIYIQVDIPINSSDPRVVVRTKISNPSIENLKELYSELSSLTDANISLQKPKRFRVGESSTIAIVENAFQTDDSVNINLEAFKNTLDSLERVLDRFCEVKGFDT